MTRQKLPIMLILLLAAALRLTAITSIPPGMTHDEADHGLDAWGVVQGIRPIYFPTASGREPLFDYASAGLMSFLGPTILAGRLVAVFASLILIAATYAWLKQAFNQRIALLTTLALATNFWALMTARHALRSILMPTFLMLAIYWFWRPISKSVNQYVSKSVKNQEKSPPSLLPWRLGDLAVTSLPAGLLLGISFYTYIPSRITWLLLPALLIFWLIFDRPQAHRHWQHIFLTLFIAATVGFPLFYHLATTKAEARLRDLDGPLERARDGDFSSLISNTQGALKLFTMTGDDGPISIRYNLPGRPLLTPIIGILFYAGLILALMITFQNHRWRTPAAFSLMWLVAGLSPALITGPEAATTRAIAMQPILFLFPALAIDQAGRFLENIKDGQRGRTLIPILWSMTIMLFAYTTWDTANSYFVEWANLPDVRVQYETTRVTALRWLNDHGTGATAIASPRPDRFHDPSTALMVMHNPAVTLRWFNGKSDDGLSGGLVLPDSAETTLLISSWGALHPALQPYLANIPIKQTLPMRPSDLDRPIDIYQFDSRAHAQQLQQQFTPVEPVLFGKNLTLLAYDLIKQPSPASPTIQLATLWRIEQPIENLKLFPHLPPAPDQPPIAQQDRLDVPSYYWQKGDIFIQLHEVVVSAEFHGPYQLIIGVYQNNAPDNQPPLKITRNGTPLGTTYPLTPITLP